MWWVGAPASDLVQVARTVHGSPGGQVIEAYVASAYSTAYPDISFETLVRPDVRDRARTWATMCNVGPDSATLMHQASEVGGSIFAVDPEEYTPFGNRLRENTPNHPVAAPIFVAQGMDDLVVPVAMQEQFVAARCAAGATIELRTYAGRDHGTILFGSSPAEVDIAAWTADRFAAVPQETGCHTSTT